MSAPDLPGTTALLLFSGGQDSAALASWLRPAGCLTVDYGQRPVEGEVRAARAITASLGLPLFSVACDMTAIGSGLLAGPSFENTATNGGGPIRTDVQSPSPEWWPYRNQLLATIASAWGLPRGYDVVVMGSVAGDSARHRDGGAEFYEAIDAVTRLQEGSVRVVAPALTLTSGELITASGISDNVLAYAHSCHIADYACGFCPGCVKNETVLRDLGRLQ